MQLQCIEINTNIVIIVITRHGHIDGRFIDARRFGQLSVLLQITRFIGRVLVHNVHLFVLKVTLAHQYNVTRGNPNLFAHLSANVPQT